ncbi:UDP-glucosyltransferase 2-like [Epargyreus clarus]|uniref:UDP-glucosyltransferase 2-like n=1 Tax=Epargyreus clarus TaxID=520877 RepID=UPI003C2F220B
MVTVRFLFLVILCQWKSVESLNILGIFVYEGPSHFFVFKQYLEKLAEKGHNLTVISHFPREEVIPNYHDISLAGTIKIPQGAMPMERSFWTIIKITDYILAAGNNDCKVMLENESVQELWKSKRKFDLVIMEHFTSDCGLGLAYKLDAPVVQLKTSDFTPWQYGTFGIPFNPSYAPFIMTSNLKSSVYKRVEKTILHHLLIFKYMNAQKVDQETLGKYFDIPPLEQLSREVKFLLLNHNFVLTGSRLLPSNVIEVGGYHVAPPKPLPADIQKYVEESKNGVIYISFGTLLNEASLPEYKMKAILDALAELPQRVVWKWNGQIFSGDRNKIYAAKWLPQNDLLAHPNVHAFFSHSGHLSAIEAIFHGVPMIAMPVLGDQPAIADCVERSGLGVQIALNELTKDELLNKFRTVLASDFRARVKSLSRAYSARPASAMSSAIFWTEFAAQHNVSARHPAADVPLHQYLCLDVIAVIGTFITICILILWKVLNLLLSFTRKFINLNVKNKRD